MLKYKITMHVPELGIVEEPHNGYDLTTAVNAMLAKYAFRGLVISAELMFKELEINKLNNLHQKRINDVLTDKE